MRKILHKLHLWMGLILCIPLVLLGLSGSILVFQHELEDLFVPQTTSVTGTPRAAGEILQAVRAKAPEGFAPVMFRPAATSGGMATVFLAPASRKSADGNGRIQMLVDPATLAVSNAAGGVMRQIFLFHSNLMLRDYGGRSIVGWFGGAMLLFGLTGLVIWWPKAGKWHKAFLVRRTSQGRKFHRELHGAAGIWSVLVLIIVSFTGVYLAFPRTVEAALNEVTPVRDMRAPPAIAITPVEGRKKLDIDAAIALAQEAVPDSRLNAVMLQAKPDQPYRVILRRLQDRDGSPAISVFIDPWTKRVIETRDPQEYSIADTFIAWQHAVHAGQAFGWVWRFLVFLAGLMPLLFAFTGISMWLIKRRS